MVSVTAPGVWFGDAPEARKYAREMNEYAMARMVGDHKGRFGLFAVLPLPDVDGALREIEYALDTLKADGIGMLTSYGNTWLGDPSFAPVMEELNRRQAVVYTHPTDAQCCQGLIPRVANQLLEYPPTRPVPVSQTLFGTDAPFFDQAPQVAGPQRTGFSATELRSVERDNALALLPSPSRLTGGAGLKTRGHRWIL